VSASRAATGAIIRQDLLRAIADAGSSVSSQSLQVTAQAGVVANPALEIWDFFPASLARGSAPPGVPANFPRYEVGQPYTPHHQLGSQGQAGPHYSTHRLFEPFYGAVDPTYGGLTPAYGGTFNVYNGTSTIPVGVSAVPVRVTAQSLVNSAAQSIYQPSVLAPTRLRISRTSVANSASALQDFVHTKRDVAISAIADAVARQGLSESYSERLKELIALVDEEYPDTDYPSPAAIDAFARAIARVNPRVQTAISALPDGALWAHWKRSDGGDMAMVAKRSGALAFGAVVKGASVKPTRVDISGGIDALDQVAVNPVFAQIFIR
jgi:hypothetical protein